MDALGQLYVGEGARAQGVEAEAVQAVDVEVPWPVGARPDLQHPEAQRLLPHLRQRRQLRRERDDEVVAVRTDVVQGGVVGVGREQILDGLAREDVRGRDVQFRRLVGRILGGERRRR